MKLRKEIKISFFVFTSKKGGGLFFLTGWSLHRIGFRFIAIGTKKENGVLKCDSVDGENSYIKCHVIHLVRRRKWWKEERKKKKKERRYCVCVQCWFLTPCGFPGFLSCGCPRPAPCMPLPRPPNTPEKRDYYSPKCWNVRTPLEQQCVGSAVKGKSTFSK